MLIQVINGMSYLHVSRRIIHRDLKSNNILLSSTAHDANTRAMIADFGLATMKKGNSATAGGVQGSVMWMAPEIITTKKDTSNPYTFKSDVYAFGIVMYELFAGQLPYKAAMEQIVFCVGRGLMKPDMKKLVEIKAKEKIQAVMQRCIAKDPADRPEFQEVEEDVEALINSIPALSRTMSKAHRRGFNRGQTSRNPVGLTAHSAHAEEPGPMARSPSTLRRGGGGVQRLSSNPLNAAPISRTPSDRERAAPRTVSDASQAFDASGAADDQYFNIAQDRGSGAYTDLTGGRDLRRPQGHHHPSPMQRSASRGGAPGAPGGN